MKVQITMAVGRKPKLENGKYINRKFMILSTYFYIDLKFHNKIFERN